MECPQCGKGNAEDAQFCAHCGAPLEGGPQAAPAPEKTSGLATASLILGLVGIPTCVTTVPGLILGIVALSKIRRSRGKLGGQGLAIAGIVLSGAFLLLYVLAGLLALMLMPALSRARAAARQAVCKVQLEQLGHALTLFELENGALPPAEGWCDALVPTYVVSEKVFQCPELPDQRCAYGFNANLSGVSISQLTTDLSRTVLVFEASGGWNASGGPELMLREPRHLNGILVLFGDYHVEPISPEQLDQLLWEPPREGPAGRPLPAWRW